MLTDLKTLGVSLAAAQAAGVSMAFDLETTSLNPRTGAIVSMQFRTIGGEPMTLDMRGYRTGAMLTELGRVLAPLFETCLIIGHNLKFDYSWLRAKFGIRPVLSYDTMLAEQVIFAGQENKGYGLKAVADRRGISLPVPMDKGLRDWFIGCDTDPEKWTRPFPDAVRLYMEADVLVLHPIVLSQIADLEDKTLSSTVHLEFAALPATVELEANGMCIDRVGWQAFMDQKKHDADQEKEGLSIALGPAMLTARAKKMDLALERFHAWEQARDLFLESLKADFTTRSEAGTLPSEKWGEYKNEAMKAWREEHPNPGRPKIQSDINIDSQVQLLEAFGELGIPGIASTNDEALKKLSGSFPIIHTLRKYRKLQKFVTSYGESFLNDPEIYDPSDGRYHFQYTQCGASTGRYTASRIQQIPARGEGQALRKNIIAAPGCVLVTCDYSAIELRVLAEVAQEASLISAFRSGQDIHSAIARRMFDLPQSVDPKTTFMKDRQGNTLGKTYRDASKQAEYATIYGTGPATLAEVMEVSVEVARDTQNLFAKQYPAVMHYLDRAHKKAIAMEESRTIGGRARFFVVPKRPIEPDYDEQRQYRASIAGIQRAAANASIQGTSADITKSAIALLYGRLRTWNALDIIKIVACVHDEIVLEAPQHRGSEAGALLADCMNRGARKYLKQVPIDCQPTISHSWEH